VTAAAVRATATAEDTVAVGATVKAKAMAEDTAAAVVCQATNCLDQRRTNFYGGSGGPHRTAHRKPAAAIQAEAEKLAADAAYRAEAMQLLRDMETLRAC
jgi:hypothetical protein